MANIASRFVQKLQGRIGYNHIAQINQTVLVDRDFPQQSRFIVITGDNAIVGKNGDQTLLARIDTNAGGFHGDHLIHYKLIIMAIKYSMIEILERNWEFVNKETSLYSIWEEDE